MDLEFALPEDKKEQVFALASEMGELVDLAEDAQGNEDKDEAERYLSSASEMLDQLDALCKEIDGYQEHKDLWRSGQQAWKENHADAAFEDMRNFLESFK